jgi:alpha-glucosidase
MPRRHEAVTRLPWWKQTVVYQIYPRSFADGNGDGIGDLRGIIGKLDYLRDLGVETLWLSPFYASPQADFGYDIADYRAVAPEYGDLDTALTLVEEAHRRGLKVVLDMVLNHTSDQHPWFLESRSSRDNPKRDWYVWRDGKKPGGKAPPNNWNAMIGGSGWHYDARTDQWYWAQFLPFQPDLNYRNPEVQEAMLSAMRFWLDRGIDGFRLDIVNALFEDAEFRDNPFAWTLLPTDEDPSMFFQGSDRTLNHPDTVAFMRVLRRMMDAYDDPPRFLVGEVNASMEMVLEHCCEGEGLHLVFLFKSLVTPLEAKRVRALIAEYEARFEEPLIPTWVFGNHDRARRIDRLGGDLERAKLNAALQLTARGVPFLYYGEEIGMRQAKIPVRRALDPLPKRLRWLPQPFFDAVHRFTHESINRDECRTPMQWDAGRNAGFCPEGVAPWLPTSADATERSVAAQTDDPGSLLSCYRRLLSARRESPALHAGDLTLLDGRGDVVSYVRRPPEEGGPRALVHLNCSAKEAELPPPPQGARLLVSTDHRRDQVGAGPLRLAPWEGLVLSVP